METKKTAAIAKNIILGKHKPAPILRLLCWFTIIWDSIIALWMLVSGLVFIVKNEGFSSNDLLKNFNQEFCFTYAHTWSFFTFGNTYVQNETNRFLHLYCIQHCYVSHTIYLYRKI
ncbi:hypothetical protein N9544_07240 [Flavobacteriales bacterium]|nr:hypothetical protein [Flavobacteriales bacterium]